jgi:hypothetical protein
MTKGTKVSEKRILRYSENFKQKVVKAKMIINPTIRKKKNYTLI